MRGAGQRLDNDVRRLWRCAACGVERKVGAQVTTVRCQCAGRPAMKLVEAMRRERPLKELSSPYLEFVFEPGELAPPRSQADDPAKSGNGNPPDSETSAAIDREVSEGGPVPPEENGPRPTGHQNSSDAEMSTAIDREVNEGGPVPREGEGPRPPRRNDRRGDRGPASAKGSQGRTDQGSRRDPPPQQRDQPPRQNQRGPGERRPDQPGGHAPAGQNAPRRDNPPRQRDDRPAPPPPAPDSDSFGEGIPGDRPPESQT